MTLFEVLADNKLVIVWSSAENERIYTWNQYLTLQCWEYYEHGWSSESGDDYAVISCRVLTEQPKNFEEAREAAEIWALGEAG